MPLTNFPFGVSSFGVPLMGNGGPLSIPGPNGRAIFVNGAIGSGVADGTIDNPYATITLALAAAQDGDTIYIFPATYNETLIVTKDYITLAGAQYAGFARPDIGPLATTQVALTVRGQGFMAKHCRFFGNAADVVVQNGNGFLFQDCVFDGDATAAKAGLRLLPAAIGSTSDTSHTASEGLVAGCLFRGNANGIIFDTAAATLGVGSTDNQINGNTFYSNTLDIATADSGTASTYSMQLTDIVGNIFADKNKATYVDLTTANGGPASAQTGSFASNGFASDTMTTTKIKAAGTGFTFMGNYDTVGIFDGSGLD